jgi:hypothetical protein
MAGKGRLRCSMPTSTLSLCSRPARFQYIREVAESSMIVAAVCAQHYRAGGHSRMLRPWSWEYDRVWDAAAGFNVEGKDVR